MIGRWIKSNWDVIFVYICIKYFKVVYVFVIYIIFDFEYNVIKNNYVYIRLKYYKLIYFIFLVFFFFSSLEF